MFGDETPLARLRHDLANPLSALLAELQLLQMTPGLDPEVAAGLKTLEGHALRMRSLLRESRDKPE